MFFYSQAVILILLTASGIFAISNKIAKFLKIKPTHAGPRRLSSAWVERSRASCAASCLARFPNCYGFMYDKFTHHCTPSSGLSAQHAGPSLDEGDFYFIDSCQSYPDFSIKSCVTTTVNVAYYNKPKLNYTNARAVCQAMNSHLYVPNTLVKLALISAITNIMDGVYVGLDDMVVEGQFVWADSKQPIDSSLKIILFFFGQPDNYNDQQDCVIIDPLKRLLDDKSCSVAEAFVCEKTLC